MKKLIYNLYVDTKITHFELRGHDGEIILLVKKTFDKFM